MKFASSLILAIVICFSVQSQAAGHGKFGLNAGLGYPYLAQGGVNFYFTDDFGLDLNYGYFKADFGEASAKLSMPSIMFKYHPFSGSFFIAGGAGQEDLDVTGTNESTGQKAEIEVRAISGIAQLGWMWGSQDGGLWFGLDLSYIIPTNAKTDITTSLPPSDQAYKDAQDDADRFGKTSYLNITFARLGYLF